MKINTKLDKPVWFDYNNTVKFYLRSFPINDFNLLSDDFESSNPKIIGLKIASYCLVDWEGFETEDGKKFECNEKNKEYLLSYYPEFIDFISKKVESLKNVEPHTIKKKT